MQSPQFSKGQTLTAEALNEISQNLRDLASRVGRAGLASRYVGPSPLRKTPDSTGEPVYLSPADVGGSGGVYLRAPWVEDSLRLSTSAVLADPAAITRADGSALAAGDEIFQKITVDSWGNPLSTALEVVNSGSALPSPSAWNPATGTSGVLYRRLGSVIADPRMATSSVTGFDMPFRPLVVLHSDGSVPILPRNSTADSGSVQLVGSLTGSTLPIKTLVAGSGVSLSDDVSSVTLTSNADSVPLAQFNTNTIDPATGQEAAPVPGKIRALGFTVADEPSIQNGEILFPLAHDVESGSVMAVGALQTAAATHNISRPQIMRGELQIPFASSGVPGLISDIQVSDSGPALSDGVLIIPPPSGGGGSVEENLKGLYDVNGSSVLWQDMPTDVDSALTLSYYYIGSYLTYLKAHSVDGFLKLTLQLDGNPDFA